MAATPPRRPGGALATRPLQFIWLVDCSGSMNQDGKIQALNNAARETLPHLRQVAAENPNADVLMRVVRFSSGASWHLAQPTPVDDFRWTDLQATGLTDLGAALRLVAAELTVPPMNPRSLPPVLVLVSDGQPTDDFEAGLAELTGEVWGQKAVRIAIAIGQDADHDVLERFMGTPGARALQANSAEALVRSLRWASTAALQGASAAVPAAPPAGPIVDVPTDSGSDDGRDVW